MKTKIIAVVTLYVVFLTILYVFGSYMQKSKVVTSSGVVDTVNLRNGISITGSYASITMSSDSGKFRPVDSMINTDSGIFMFYNRRQDRLLVPDSNIITAACAEQDILASRGIYEAEIGAASEWFDKECENSTNKINHLSGYAREYEMGRQRGLLDAWKWILDIEKR